MQLCKVGTLHPGPKVEQFVFRVGPALDLEWLALVVQSWCQPDLVKALMAAALTL
jgi:hypothetical protein